MFRKFDSVEDRFDSHVFPEPNTGCWLYDSKMGQSGYGYIRIGGKYGKNVYAHRFSYERYVGKIPLDKFVLHKCDVPACVNPDHLFLGNDAINVADKVSKNRQKKGTEMWQTKMTPETVKEARELFAKGDVKNIDLARKYNINPTSIFNILKGKTWKHLK